MRFVEKLQYHRNGSTDFDEIWHAAGSVKLLQRPIFKMAAVRYIGFLKLDFLARRVWRANISSCETGTLLRFLTCRR